MRDLDVSADRPHTNPFPFPSVAERVSWHLQEETHRGYVSPHPWAIRHHFTNTQTGETIRVRCNLWTCEYCGPRKVDEWRQVIHEAKPLLHLVLTKVGGGSRGGCSRSGPFSEKRRTLWVGVKVRT